MRKSLDMPEDWTMLPFIASSRDTFLAVWDDTAWVYKISLRSNKKNTAIGYYTFWTDTQNYSIQFTASFIWKHLTSSQLTELSKLCSRCYKEFPKLTRTIRQ